MKRRSELVPLTRGLFEEFYEFPPPYRLKGYAVLVDGKPAAVGGLGYRGPWLEVFLDSTDAGKAAAKTLVKGARRVVADGRKIGLPMIAAQDPNEPTAERFLSRLGFRKDEDDLWRID